MNLCPKCHHVFDSEELVCPYDGEPLQPLTDAWESSPVEPKEGDLLGSYRILTQIAEGGMARIFRAKHVQIGRLVALKVLKARLLDPTNIIRFFKEARAVNEIHHPNIIRIEDFVLKINEGIPLVYMVMELLHGIDLRTRIFEVGQLAVEEAVEITSQIAQALFAVHRANLLHRDLKPENIFLLRSEAETTTTEEDSVVTNVIWHNQTQSLAKRGCQIKLLDFGIAKSLPTHDQAHKYETDPSICIGTPAYMTPEYIIGKTVDERSDIYSLGLVLYEMLTGKVPFASSNQDEILRCHVTQAPPPISTYRQVPPELAAVVMQCIEKDPLNRYLNMRALDRALRDCIENEKVKGGSRTLAAREVPDSSPLDIVPAIEEKTQASPDLPGIINATPAPEPGSADCDDQAPKGTVVANDHTASNSRLSVQVTRRFRFLSRSKLKFIAMASGVMLVASLAIFASWKLIGATENEQVDSIKKSTSTRVTHKAEIADPVPGPAIVAGQHSRSTPQVDAGADVQIRMTDQEPVVHARRPEAASEDTAATKLRRSVRQQRKRRSSARLAAKRKRMKRFRRLTKRSRPGKLGHPRGGDSASRRSPPASSKLDPITGKAATINPFNRNDE